MATSRKRTGRFEPEELEEIMKHVLACNGGKVDQSLPQGVDWEALASRMNRTRSSVYDVYRSVSQDFVDLIELKNTFQGSDPSCTCSVSVRYPGQRPKRKFAKG